LNRKNKKYDLFVFDPIYTKKYSPFLTVIDDWLPEYIEWYSEGASEQTSKYKGHWYSLPTFQKYKVMYSNLDYLKKYNMSIPLTWNEFIDTAEYILEKEHNLYNNTMLVGYNGFFPKNENSVCSLYEFVYSFRDEKSSPFPHFDSETAYEALEKLVEVKNRVSSNDLFLADETHNLGLLFTESIIFISLWDGFAHPSYKMTVLPGKKPGISGSALSSLNIGIPNFIDKKNKEASIQVLKFINSKEAQKKILKDFNLYSAIPSLYEDDNDEICKVRDCQFARNVQGIDRPIFQFDNYEVFSTKVIEILDGVLFHDKPIKEAITELDNISRFHKFSINDGSYSLVLMIISITLLGLLILTPIVLFIPALRKYFLIFSVYSWLIFIIGLLMILSTVFTYLGELKSSTCLERQVLLTLGYTLILIPALFKLAVNFPKINKYSDWIHNNKYIFIAIIIGIESFLNLFYLIFPMKIRELVMNKNEKNFSKCSFHTGGLVIAWIQIIIKLVLYILIDLLIFLEWNIRKIFYSTRVILLFITINELFFIVFIILKHMSISTFNVYYTLEISLIITIIFINYIYMFVIRLFHKKLGAIKDEEKLINSLLKFNNMPSNISSNMTSNVDQEKLTETKTGISNSTSTSKQNSSISSKILIYHYATESFK
ncbi:periplasmic binding protein-like II, partial [Neocallimastix californiae]